MSYIVPLFCDETLAAEELMEDDNVGGKVEVKQHFGMEFKCTSQFNAKTPTLSSAIPIGTQRGSSSKKPHSSYPESRIHFEYAPNEFLYYFTPSSKQEDFDWRHPYPDATLSRFSNSLQPGSPPFGSYTKPSSNSSLNESLFSFKTNNAHSNEQSIEKQRKRKENHNAIERRRRDMINTLISKLSYLVSVKPNIPENSSPKYNKSDILDLSIQHILHINNICLEVAAELSRLEPDNAILLKNSEFLRSLRAQLDDSVN